jgi:hypothetical protein
MLLVLVLAGHALAHGPAVDRSGLLTSGGGVRPAARAEALRASPMARAFADAARMHRVPEGVLVALAYQASGLEPEVVSRWGGWGLFDLREGEEEPSLEHAAGLVGRDPNRIAGDWRLSVDAAAALLAAHARQANGGRLPPADDPSAWWDAVRAFSGQHAPVAQDFYGRLVFGTVMDGLDVVTRHGRVVVVPTAVDLPQRARPPAPPFAADSALVADVVETCGYDGESSANFTGASRTPSDIDMIVIHTMQGSYGGSMSWFANCDASASAHYNLRSSDGRVGQSVRERDIAWHAGHWSTNERSIGIEHEGYVSDPGRWYTEAMYEASADLVADLTARLGISVDRDHIIAHYEVPGCSSGNGGGSGCHTDPGSGWDWDHYMDLVNDRVGVGAGAIVGYVRDGDIYNGANLVGATVTLMQTGETTTVDAEGLYRFDDVPFGSWTMRARMPGYADGECAKTTDGAEEWCSIALGPAADVEGEDTGSIPPPSRADIGLPGSLHRFGSGGCATVDGSIPRWLVVIGALGACLRRRRVR